MQVTYHDETHVVRFQKNGNVFYDGMLVGDDPFACGDVWLKLHFPDASETDMQQAANRAFPTRGASAYLANMQYQDAAARIARDGLFVVNGEDWSGGKVPQRDKAHFIVKLLTGLRTELGAKNRMVHHVW